MRIPATDRKPIDDLSHSSRTVHRDPDPSVSALVFDADSDLVTEITWGSSAVCGSPEETCVP